MLTGGLLSLGLWLAAVSAEVHDPVSDRIPPVYDPNPFGDADFEAAPLIRNVRYPSRGRGEWALLFSTSAIDKYTSHTGGMLDVTYFVWPTFGFGATFGFMHGVLTNIVTDPVGIIGRTMDECLRPQTPSCADTDINPRLPDDRQITGIFDLVATWAPLYGKISLVSEMDVNLQLYGLAGFGVNGTRRISAVALPDAANVGDFRLRGRKFGAGGLFSDAKGNGTVGVGVRIFVSDRIRVRAEYRTVFFRDRFAFDGQNSEAYFSAHHFGQVGLGFAFL